VVSVGLPHSHKCPRVSNNSETVTEHWAIWLMSMTITYAMGEVGLLPINHRGENKKREEKELNN